EPDAHEFAQRAEPHMAEVPSGIAPVAAETPVSASEQAIAELAGAFAGEAGKRIVVTGAARHVGTTLTAVALARELGQPARAVLVDLAFAHPNLAAFAADPAA